MASGQGVGVQAFRVEGSRDLGSGEVGRVNVLVLWNQTPAAKWSLQDVTQHSKMKQLCHSLVSRNPVK